MIRFPFILIILFYSCTNSTILQCGDLLSLYAEKPVELEFLECSKEKGQVILRSKYRVSGKDSKKIEQVLISKYGLGKLKFNCCGWESEKYGQINPSKIKAINPNFSILITMYGNAEKKDKNNTIYIEKNRNKIPYFYVIVEIVEV